MKRGVPPLRDRIARRGCSVLRTMHQELRVAGLFLRRRQAKESSRYMAHLPYDASDYEVLLRLWPSEPFKSYLGAFSGPALPGEEPEATLLRESKNWVEKMAGEAGVSVGDELGGRRAVFLSVHGGGRGGQANGLNLGLFLGYIVPLTCHESSVIDRYPNSPLYPKFYQLSTLLRGMVSEDIKVHPLTREMLSALDHWLREQHAIPGAINALFAPSLKTRIRQTVVNPLFEEGGASTPNHPLRGGAGPLLTSVPHYAEMEREEERYEHQPVDFLIKNPLFGSGLHLQKANCVVVNKHFGHGAPDYDAVGQRKGKWIVQVKGDGLPDWTEMYPVHKFSCEGDGEGICRCLQLGMDPDEKDTDSWAPLHYACWYGELEAVKALVEDGAANIAIQNSSGSTPLHLAAATGHTAVVEYLLSQRGMARVKAALDGEGKSPLAVCLEFKMNDWQRSAQLLREAYKSEDGGVLSPSPLSSRASSIDHLLAAVNEVGSQEDLGLRGSQADITATPTPQHNAKKKKKKGGEVARESAQTVRRQRVNLMTGQHHVVHFFRGRETPASDVIRDLFRVIRLSKEYHSLFALWISSKQLELQIGDTDKPLKLMSSWKQLLTKYSSDKGHGSHGNSSPENVPTFQLRRNLFFPITKEKLVKDPLALQLLYADAQSRVLSGYYPCSEDDAIYLAGISMQINYGDHNPAVHQPGFLREKLGEVLPSHLITAKRKTELERKVLTEHAQTNKDEAELLYVHYLEHCWQWPHYGATFFGNSQAKDTKLPSSKAKGKLGKKSVPPVKVGVNTQGFHLANAETNELIQSLGFESVEWDVSSEKQQLVIYRRDRSLHLLIHTKKAALIYSLVTRLLEQSTGVSLQGSRTSTNVYNP